MITLEKIQELDKKIQEAVTLITTLRQEKQVLKEQLEQNRLRMSEMEEELSSARVGQDQIEEGILDALSKFDGISQGEAPKEETEVTDEESSSDTEDSDVDEPEEETSVVQNSEREESVIDEEEEEPEESSDASMEFSFSGGTMAAEEKDDQVNHSEPQSFAEDQNSGNVEEDSEGQPEEEIQKESRSEQDLDIF